MCRQTHFHIPNHRTLINVVALLLLISQPKVTGDETDDIITFGNNVTGSSGAVEQTNLVLLLFTAPQDGVLFGFSAFFKSQSRFKFQIWRSNQTETTRPSALSLQWEIEITPAVRWAREDVYFVSKFVPYCPLVREGDVIGIQQLETPASLTYAFDVTQRRDIGSPRDLGTGTIYVGEEIEFDWAKYPYAFGIQAHMLPAFVNDTSEGAQCPRGALLPDYDPPTIVGEMGARGEEGPTGAPGLPGPSGLPGLQGGTGPIGSPGQGGSTGPPGETGSMGSGGTRGVLGGAGATGPRGAKGDSGAPGPSGDAGPPGQAVLINKTYLGDIKKEASSTSATTLFGIHAGFPYTAILLGGLALDTALIIIAALLLGIYVKRRKNPYPRELLELYRVDDKYKDLDHEFFFDPRGHNTTMHNVRNRNWVSQPDVVT